MGWDRVVGGRLCRLMGSSRAGGERPGSRDYRGQLAGIPLTARPRPIGWWSVGDEAAVEGQRHADDEAGGWAAQPQGPEGGAVHDRADALAAHPTQLVLEAGPDTARLDRGHLVERCDVLVGQVSGRARDACRTPLRPSSSGFPFASGLRRIPTWKPSPVADRMPGNSSMLCLLIIGARASDWPGPGREPAGRRCWAGFRRR